MGMIGAVEHGHFFLDSAWFRSSCGLLKVAAGLLCASWTYLLIGWSQRVWKFKCLSSSHMLSTAGTTPEVRVPQSHHISPLTDIAGDGEGPHLKTGKCHFSPSRELLCVMCWLQTSSRNYFDGSALNASMITDCIRQYQWETVSPCSGGSRGSSGWKCCRSGTVWEWKNRRAKCCWSLGLTPTAAPV